MAGFTLGVLAMNGDTNPTALGGSMAHDMRDMANRRCDLKVCNFYTVVPMAYSVSRDTLISAALAVISQYFKYQVKQREPLFDYAHSMSYSDNGIDIRK